MCPEYLSLLAAISDSRIQNFRSDEFYCTFYESLACEDFDSTGDDDRDQLLLSLLLYMACQAFDIQKLKPEIDFSDVIRTKLNYIHDKTLSYATKCYWLSLWILVAEFSHFPSTLLFQYQEDVSEHILSEVGLNLPTIVEVAKVVNNRSAVDGFSI